MKAIRTKRTRVKKLLGIAVAAMALAALLVLAGCAASGGSGGESSVSGSGQSASATSEQAQSTDSGSEETAQTERAETGPATEETVESMEEGAQVEAEDVVEPAQVEEASGAADQAEAGGKTLVVCWSQTGNTKPLAEYVADITGADFCEIVAEEPYTQDDLNYNDSSTRATVEQQQTPEVRPAIAGELPNMDDYDTVFVAHPIWWGKAPRIVLTFLESVDLSGKTVVEFVTSGSSGIEGAEGETHAAAPDANWLEGRRFDAGTSRETMEEWVAGLGL